MRREARDDAAACEKAYGFTHNKHALYHDEKNKEGESKLGWRDTRNTPLERHRTMYEERA